MRPVKRRQGTNYTQKYTQSAVAKGKKQKRTDRRYKGKVGIRSFKGRLSLRLPRTSFGGHQKVVPLGIQDNTDNWRTAERLAAEIDRDIKSDFFDMSQLLSFTTTKSSTY